MATSDVVQLTPCDYETRRTKARPRHTLFGTTLETHSREDLEGMRQLDVNELRQRKQTMMTASNRYDRQMPEHLSGSLTEQREQLDWMQRRLWEQVEKASDSSKRLKSLEEMYKYFKVDDVSRSLDRSPERSDHLQGTLDPVNQMTNGRTIGRRYGLHSSVTPAPFHLNECSIDDGDLFQPPVFLNHLPSQCVVGRAEPVSDINALRRDKGSPRSRTTHRTYFEHDNYANNKLIELPDSLTDSHGRYLPANVQHKFGTRLCQSVFSCDPCLLEQTTASSRRTAVTSKRRRGSHGPQRDSRPNGSAADYHSLGHLLRYNLGHTYGRQFDKGVTQSDFNHSSFSSVNNRPLPSTDQYRYRKDDLNKWAEQDIIRSRTTKAWDDRQAEIKDSKRALV